MNLFTVIAWKKQHLWAVCHTCSLKEESSRPLGPIKQNSAGHFANLPVLLPPPPLSIPTVLFPVSLITHTLTQIVKKNWLCNHVVD